MGDFDDLLEKQTKSNVGDFDDLLDSSTQQLPEVTEPSNVTIVGFAHPTTKEKAEKYDQAWADKQNENAGNAYTLARSILSIPASLVGGTGEYIKDRVFNEGSWADLSGDPITTYITNSMEAANKGEGVVGMLSNPVNAALMGSGAVMGAGRSAVGDLGRGVIVQGAGSGVDYLANEKNPNAQDLLRNTAVGGLVGGLGNLIFNKPTRDLLEKESKYAADIAANDVNLANLIKSKESNLNRFDRFKKMYETNRPTEEINFLETGLPQDVSEKLGKIAMKANKGAQYADEASFRYHFLKNLEREDQLNAERQLLQENYNKPLYDTKEMGFKLYSDLFPAQAGKQLLIKPTLDFIDRKVPQLFNTLDNSILPVSRNINAVMPYGASLTNKIISTFDKENRGN